MSSRFSQFLPESISGPRPDVDVADLVEESVAVFNLNLMVSAWNTEAERLYGWRRDEVIGGKIQAAVRCAPSESLAVILAKVHEQGEWRGEFVRSTKSGAKVVVNAKWSLRRDADGHPVDIVETSRDITEVRRSEEAFARMRYEVPEPVFFISGLILGVGIFRGRAAAAGSQGIGRRRFRSLLRAES